MRIQEKQKALVQMYGNCTFKSHRVTLFEEVHYKYMIFVRLFGYHITVSYTHLDVYKRQVQRHEHSVL